MPETSAIQGPKDNSKNNNSAIDAIEGGGRTDEKGNTDSGRWRRGRSSEPEVSSNDDQPPLFGDPDETPVSSD